MKLMIASDLHGSNYYVKKLMDRFQAEGADKLLLLGDLLYHGPRNALPEEYSCPSVADQLNAIKEKIVAVFISVREIIKSGFGSRSKYRKSTCENASAFLFYKLLSKES